MTVPADAVVIGAGPYGIAVGAELRRAGVNAHVIGDPMSFWMRHMPRGMCLRSIWEASHIGDPHGPLSFDVYEKERGTRIARPVPLADFVAYGHWVQAQAVPDLDPRGVAGIDARDGSFAVALTDGESIETRRVVVAAGIQPFAVRPALFEPLGAELVSHSVDLAEIAHFAGRRVAVIGGGQSAIETAVLLQETGADVEVLMRAPRLGWVGRAPRDGIVGPLLFDRTDVGPAVWSHLVAHPLLVRALPRRVQREAVRLALAPGASLWLRPRLAGLPISAGRRVVSASRRDGRAALVLDDGSSRVVDHVVTATGYRIDVLRYPFLAGLAAKLRVREGHPLLDTGFESSVRGLHFVGAPATYSFGPLLRFVSGTEYAARMVTRRVTGRHAAKANERAARLQRATQ